MAWTPPPYPAGIATRFSPVFAWAGGVLTAGIRPANLIVANAVNRFGKGFTPPSASSFLFSGNILGPLAGATLVLVYSRTGAAQASAIGFGQLGDRLNVHFPYSDGTVYWDFGGSSGSNRLTVSGLSNYDGAWVFTAGQLGMRIWRGGVLLASSSTAVARSGAEGLDQCGFGNSNGPADTGATYDLFYCDANQFNDTLAQSVSVNPWQLFAPSPQPFWTPSGSAAPAAPVYGTLGQFDPGMRIAGWF